MSKQAFFFWEIGFFVELAAIFLLAVVVTKLTTDNADLRLRREAAISQSNKSPAPIVHPQITSWKTYSNPELGVSFRYPDGWAVNETQEDRKLGISQSVNVSSWSRECGDAFDYRGFDISKKIEDCQYYSFYIEKWSPEKLNTTNPNIFAMRERISELEKSGSPTIPGPPLYLGEENTLFTESAARIGTLPRAGDGKYQYYLISKGNLYLIELNAPDYSGGGNTPNINDNKHPIIKIIKTLKYL